MKNSLMIVKENFQIYKALRKSVKIMHLNPVLIYKLNGNLFFFFFKYWITYFISFEMMLDFNDDLCDYFLKNWYKKLSFFKHFKTSNVESNLG